MELDYIEGAGDKVRVSVLASGDTFGACEQYARDMAPEAGTLTDAFWRDAGTVVFTFERDL